MTRMMPWRRRRLTKLIRAEPTFVWLRGKQIVRPADLKEKPGEATLQRAWRFFRLEQR
jgi:hypothetical protein